MTKHTDRTFIQKLWDRKVPQFLGTYFAVGFGLLQFVEFLTRRYDLTGYIVDKYLLVWLLLVPAVAVSIYFGGEFKFKQASKKWPKIMVIGNIVIAFLLATFFFNDTTVTQTTVVEVEDESGEVMKAMVPVKQTIKKVAIFQFKNETGDPDNDWFGIASSELLHTGVMQRTEFYSQSVYSLNSYHDGLGLQSFVAPNLGMHREISQKSINDYFTSISYTIKDGIFEFSGNLYRTKDGKSVIDLTATDINLYNVIDKLKKQIFDNIPNAIKNKENQTNLPVAALITDNLDALKYHTLSRITFYNDPTALEKCITFHRQALELDQTSSRFYYHIGDALYRLGKKDEAIASLKQSIKFGRGLPERFQFNAKEALYRITNNIDANYKLQEIRRKMFPYEFRSYLNLLSFYRTEYGIEKAKGLIQEAIDNGNVEQGLLTLSQLQVDNEEYIAALVSLDTYVSAFPDRNQNKLKYAAIYEKQGRIEDAKELLLEEEALNPLDTAIQIKIAVVDYQMQNITAVNKRINEGLSQATTLSDSLSYLWTKSFFQESSGQVVKAFQTIKLYEKYAIKRTPINNVLWSTFSRKANLKQAIGKSEEIENLLTEVVKYNASDEGYFKCTLATNAIVNNFYPSTPIGEIIPSCKEVYEKYGNGGSIYYDVIVAYQYKKYDKCVELLENDDQKIESNIERFFVSKIYAKSGNYEKAKNIILKEIDKKTFEPKYYYEMASLLENDNSKEARRYLEIALTYWKNADADFIPYKRAIELSSRLNEIEQKLIL